MSPVIIFCLALVFLLFVAGFLMSRMPGNSFSGPLPELTAAERVLTENLNRHINTLAVQIGERNVMKYENLQRSAKYIEEQFLANGFHVKSVPYEISGKQFRNIEAEILGHGESSEVIIFGAHYDSLTGTVGANDNASGVAALLELARMCISQKYQKTIRFVAFVNEEPPYFKTPQMGSLVYAQQARERGENIIGMISLETVGYYTDEQSSQKFPLPLLRHFYPQQGNFVAFVGSYKHAALLKKSLGAYREKAVLPSEGLMAPEWLLGVDWSDHWSFWKAGYPALMVTDTALFRYPYYHTVHDTPEKINYPALSRLTAGLKPVVKALGR